MQKNSITTDFNPNDPGIVGNNIFGLPFTSDTAKVVLIPVPWDVTTSYKPGTSKGPSAIFNASFQVDLFEPSVKDAWKLGVSMEKIPTHILKLNKKNRKKSTEYIDFIVSGEDINEHQKIKEYLIDVNKASETLNKWVEAESSRFIKKNKLIGIIGGEHSCSFGLLKALSEKYSAFGILQFDAHADLRNSFEGFNFSHASAMFNALKIKQIKKLVQVGIRDYCEDEISIISKSKNKISTFFDEEIKSALFEGKSWMLICDEIISKLPELVFISFDIDGFNPSLCPNTGTPTPGGLSYEQALYLLKKLVDKKKKIIGFDLCEVAPGKDEWDGNVGARLTWKLINYMALSMGKFKR